MSPNFHKKSFKWNAWPSLMLSFATLLALCPTQIRAGTDGSIAGNVVDSDGIAVGNASVQLISPLGRRLKETTTTVTGDFQFFPVIFGDYTVTVLDLRLGSVKNSVHVSSGATSNLNFRFGAQTTKDIVLQVKAKRHLVQNTSSTSGSEISAAKISQLPQGDQVSLPKLISSTTAGVVAGPFGQTFIRGNHANIQYQIDGVQLPDSPSNNFGGAFSPRNIDHMEVITGGIPAEYGERLAAVVNIVTKSGPETPGGSAELNLGTSRRFSPEILYGGSNASGSLHYYLSANYFRTDRGLDTPQPESYNAQNHGGSDAIHDSAHGNNEFLRLDYLPNNVDKLSLIVFNSENFYQIPNYPDSFKVTDPFFSQPNYLDHFGNQPGNPSNTTFNFVPSNTDDTQFEANAYVEAVWKHSFSDRAFLQVAPYYKYSLIHVGNDPTNDLATSPSGATPVAGASPSSFTENRHVNNFGVKADYSLRPNEENFIKFGVQMQASKSAGSISVQQDLTGSVSYDNNPDSGYFESVYLQDDYSFSKRLSFNVGLRFDATQFSFADAHPKDSAVQPRIGVNYLLTDATKVHAFYGRLFQPAPAENLRDTYVGLAAPGTQLQPYDIKAEKDHYFEVGIAEQIGAQHVAEVNAYYKIADNMLDDAQLLNTSVAQPFNFATGFAYGIEASIKGQLSDALSDYLNYSFEVAKGKSISGGFFANPDTAGDVHTYLDHVQVHTVTGGLTYTKGPYWGSVQGLFGSGLRTGPNNTASLPSHLSFDLSGGYEFRGDAWYSRFKLSVDVLNIFDNRYAISVANGFNGSHYAAGREFFVHLVKEF